MVLLEFSMSPVGEGESVGDKVVRSIEIIEKSGLSYQTNAMGTILEGEWEDVMAVVTKCFERMKEDSGRISVVMKVDYRSGKSGRIKGKIEALEKRLGHKINTP